MSDTTDLLQGVAADLNAASAGVYDPSRTWTAADTDVAVVFSAMPDLPDRVIVLSAYRLGPDDPAHPSATINLQIRCRGAAGDAQDVDAMDDSVYVALQGLVDRTYGGVYVVQCIQKSSLPMGRDDNNRWERSSNYTLDAVLSPSPWRNYTTN